MSIDQGATRNGSSLSGQLKWQEFRRVVDAQAAGVPASGQASATASPRASHYSLTAQRRILLAWLLLTDALALGVAFRLAYWVRFDLGITLAPEVTGSETMYATFAGVLVAGWLAVLAVFGLYQLHPKFSGPVETARTFRACTMAAMLVVVATFMVPSFVVSRMWVIAGWGLSFLGVSASRFVNRRLVRAARGRGFLLAPAVIVGTNEEAISLWAFLRDWRGSGVWASGFVSAGTQDEVTAEGLPVLGSIADISDLVRRHRIEEVIVAITGVSREELLRLCEDVDGLPVELSLSSGLYELRTTRVSVRTLDTVPLMSVQKHRLTRGESAAKAAFERLMALLGLLLLWPALLAIAVAVKADSPGPVFHRRRVLGTRGRQFDALKFRTMVVDGDAVLRQRPEAARELSVNHKLKDDPRITRVGRWLRKFSLDELPQLINVLAGQMALVGPRMITPDEGGKYGRHLMNLLTVKPGITGLWQVSGRSDLSYDERIRLDMFYVRNYSIWLDFQILFIQTLPAVLRSRGAY